MNSVHLMGRLTAEPVTRYTQGAQPMCIANYTLAVNRQKDKDGNQQADFIRCIAFGKRGEFAGKYLRKGTLIAISGRIQTGSYDDKDGKKVYTTDIIVDSHYFCGSGNGQTNAAPAAQQPQYNNDFAPTNEAAPGQWTQYSGQQQGMNSGFMPIDDEIEGDDDLPF